MKTQILSTLNIVTVSFLLVVMNSCSSDKSDSSGTSTDSSDLHFAFKTPDWERKIDCSELNLLPIVFNDTTYGVSATSASTKETFCLTYPKDSSEMVRPNNYKKYKITEYYSNEEPFQFSQKLPLNSSSLDDLTKKLASKEGFSATEFNQITEIKYVRSEPTYAVFKIKGTYGMNGYLPATPDVIKPITGTYAFIIRTSKK